MADIPYYTVIEWNFFPPSSPPGVQCLFASASGYFTGWYCGNQVYVENRDKDGAAMVELEPDVVSIISLWAPLPRDLGRDIKWNVDHIRELDLSDEPPGSDRVVGMVTSPRRPKREVRLLDGKVVRALHEQISYADFLKRCRIKTNSAMEKIARQLWSLRTGVKVK